MNETYGNQSLPLFPDEEGQGHSISLSQAPQNHCAVVNISWFQQRIRLISERPLHTAEWHSLKSSGWLKIGIFYCWSRLTLVCLKSKGHLGMDWQEISFHGNRWPWHVIPEYLRISHIAKAPRGYQVWDDSSGVTWHVPNPKIVHVSDRLSKIIWALVWNPLGICSLRCPPWLFNVWTE